MKLRFWGTRGGLASPGKEYIELGGNTLCTQIYLNEEQSILMDSGTGIIEYASKSEDMKKNKEFHIFITHFHWDHIQGFPFFFPIHKKGIKIHIYSPFPISKLKKNFETLFDGSYSPLRNLSNLNADISFHQLDKDGINIYNAKILFNKLVHTDECYGYKVITDEYSLAYILDHENANDNSNYEVLQFIKNTDILIHDSQFTQEEYHRCIGWGHSSIEKAIENGINGNVKILFLTHHYTYHSDDFIRLYLDRTMKKLKLYEIKKPIIELARENKTWLVNVD